MCVSVVRVCCIGARSSGPERRCYLLKILRRIKLVTRGVVLPDRLLPEDDTRGG